MKNPTYHSLALVNDTNGTHKGENVFCPVNAYGACPYCDQCNICHIADPMEDCDDFATFFDSWEDWEGLDSLDPDLDILAMFCDFYDKKS